MNNNLLLIKRYRNIAICVVIGSGGRHAADHDDDDITDNDDDDDDDDDDENLENNPELLVKFLQNFIGTRWPCLQLHILFHFSGLLNHKHSKKVHIGIKNVPVERNG